MRKLLENKTIIVTGTARGMGNQMLRLFAENGANVIAHARTQTQEHLELCQNLAELNNVNIYPLYFDLSDAMAMKDAVKYIQTLKIAIDGLVNNAGITHNALFRMCSIEDARQQMEINYFAPYMFTQYILKFMLKNKGGSIVNISSSAALDGNSGKAAYGASKAALLCLSNVIAEEMGIYGIRSNTICPGVTQTDMLSDMPEYALDLQKSSTFLNEIGTPLDIANVAMYLLSDYSSYITGQYFRVDGGVVEYEKRKK